MRLRACLPIVVVAGALATPYAPVAASAPPEPAAPVPAVSARPANPDAAAYSAQLGISLAEADARLAKQALAGDLDALLTRTERDVLAGVWLEHEPVFRVVVAVTDPAAAPRVVARAGALRADLDVRFARYSAGELVAAAREGQAALRASGVRSDAMTDVRRNVAVVRVLDRDAALDALRRTGRSLPAAVVVEQVPELIKAEIDMYAGEGITLCTSGFTVQNGTGTRGISTAGHCDNAQSYGGNTLTYQSGQTNGSVDAQWHTPPAGHTLRAWIRDGINDTVEPFRRMVTGRTGRDAQVVGSWVCKHGVTTGYTCGSISNKTTLPFSPVTNGTATYIYVAGGTTNLSEGGDSGGPWFSGTNAYGLHHGGAGNDSIYMAVNYLESGLSLTVLTGPANDDFGNAATAGTSTSFTVTGSNANASTQTSEPAPTCQGSYGNSVWYNFTAPESGLYRLDTVGSGFDTVLSVHTGSSVSGLTNVDCDDNGGGSLRSRLFLTLMANQQYRIRVAGVGTASGGVTLNVAKVNGNGVPSGYTSCVNEGSTCSFSGTRDVIYGNTHGVFVVKVGVSGSIACTTAAFGKDPDPGFLKTCYTSTAGSGGWPSGFSWCANEGGSCSWTGTRHLIYGNEHGTWALLNGVTSGFVPCRNSAFWDVEPGWSKFCGSRT